MAIPVAIYLLTVWGISTFKREADPAAIAMPIGAVLALATALAGLPIHLIAADLALVMVIVAVSPGSRRATASTAVEAVSTD